MKRIISSFAIILALIVLTTGISYAQDGGSQISVGGGLSYGEQIDKIGIKADGYYSITEEIRVGADLVYYFPDKVTILGTEITTNYFAININGNYIFYDEDQFMAYGLAGLNILSISSEAGGTSSSTSEAGLNLGAGGEYALDFGNIFAELKFAGIGGDADQFVVGAGVRFPI